MFFKKIRLENFCGVRFAENELSKLTLVKGKNGVGKSTIRNAISWVLFDKLADGSAADGIRPHDKDGKDIDFVDISVELTTELDGREVVFKKTQKQNWVKDRTTQEQVFKGNDNTFEINGIPKKAGEYNKYIEENIAKIEVLKYCMNPLSFLALDTKKRRAKLFELVEDFKDEEVITQNPAFEVIRNDLKDGSIDELIARSKNKINLFKKSLAEFPARIEEISNQIVDTDFAELELAKANLKAKIEKENNVIAETEKAINDLSAGNMQVLFDKVAYEKEQTKEFHKALADKSSEVSDLKDCVRSIEMARRELEQIIERERTSLAKVEEDIQIYESAIQNIDKEQFDETRTYCHTCGARLKESTVLTLKEEFAKSKESSRKEYLRLIDTCKENEERIKANISGKEKMLANDDLVKTKEKLAKAEAELEKMRAQEENLEVDTSEFDKKLEKQRIDLESLNVVLDEYKVRKDEYESSLNEVETSLLAKATNIKLEERIAELQTEQRNVSQNIANEEKMLDTLEAFNRAKVGMLTDKVNSYFEVIKWRLFERQINGGYADVCRAIVNGTDYDRTLNNGDKILAEIDICRAFMKANKLNVPVVFDNAESLDSNRIPEFDGQLIAVQRTDDEILTIERR